MNVNAIKFRKKPVVIEAYQWKESDALNLRGKGWPNWLVAATRCAEDGADQIVTQSFEGYATIKTLEGEMRADIGDWIIRGINGELYPCKPDIFAATYEPADAPIIDLNAADFSDALMWLKEGKRVCRSGWNGAGQFAWMVPPGSYPARMEAIKGHYPDDMVPYGAYFALKNAQETVVPWVPSVGDLLATDWQVYEGQSAFVNKTAQVPLSSELVKLEADIPPHQLRVLEELAQLTDRLDKLTAFFDTDVYRSLDVDERGRLKEQCALMGELQRVLTERVAAF